MTFNKMHSRLTTAAMAVCASNLLVSAQSFPKDVPIASCLEVDCPISDKSTTANCRFDSRNYTGVGVVQVPFESSGSDSDEGSPLSGITWTQAVEVKDLDDGKRSFDKRFYLGTPEGLELDEGLGGCALFFTKVGSNVEFGENRRSATGTCATALSDRCVEAINKRAAKVRLTESTSPEAACKALREEFQDNMDDACKEFAVDGEWSEIAAEPLTGPRAPEPFTESENSTANCWPTLPKSNDLAFVKSVKANGNYSVGDVMDQFFTITPILTVFFPRNSSLISGVHTGLSCLNIVEKNSATEQTENSGGDDGSGSVVVGPSILLVTASLLAVAGAAFAF